MQGHWLLFQFFQLFIWLILPYIGILAKDIQSLLKHFCRQNGTFISFLSLQFLVNLTQRRFLLAGFLCITARTATKAAEFEAANVFFLGALDPAGEKLAERPAFPVDEAVDGDDDAGKQNEEAYQSEHAWKDVRYVVGAHLGAVF